MSKLEAGLKEIEAQLDNQFGRESCSETDDDDDEEKVNGQEQEDNVESIPSEEEFSLYCIACDKVFQSERAKLNHDNSKKHRENVALLKEALEEEDNLLLNQQTEKSASEQSDKEDLDKPYSSTGEHLPSSGSDSEAEKVKSRTKASRKKKKALPVVVQDEVTDDEEPEVVELPKMVMENEKGGSEELNDTSTEKKGKKKRRRTKQEKSVGGPIVPIVVAVEDPDDSEPEPPKILCGTCKTKFNSRNKLFSHLKATNHSVYLEDGTTTAVMPEKPTKGKGRKGKTRQRDD